MKYQKRKGIKKVRKGKQNIERESTQKIYNDGKIFCKLERNDKSQLYLIAKLFENSDSKR